MGTVFSIAVTIVILGFLWFWIARPILEDYGVLEPRESVNDYETALAAPVRVMSRETRQTMADEDQTEPDGRVSEAYQWIERVKVDRTKTAWLELMVYSGYTVPEIRSILKGDNGTLGTEIEAARKRLGIEPPVQHITPIVGRPTAARFEQTDADYPYRPIET